MKTAVIRTGGKQYLVQEGDTIKVEKIPSPANKTVVFTDVLLVATDKTIKLGQPVLAGAKVEARLVSQTKSAKVTGVKMKAKKRYRRYFGHRQQLTQLQITKINLR